MSPTHAVRVVSSPVIFVGKAHGGFLGKVVKPQELIINKCELVNLFCLAAGVICSLVRSL